ncbi:MFS transporter [Aurantiacibacter rhizosphaerae]|uniref:MFS transporter n=1 Tax=Aurantiacibacter rhizosphaerae TaxID=2691582 RepID=A0A844XAF2_9SPHN|nr:MFS transporter [Aurantiacibacter rhizosphaerae]MWV26618.1 MFS transporter [Aurantiacibacter rhizosphaerae]
MDTKRGYELRVVLLLGLAYGFAYFDRMALTFVSPFVIEDLGLSNFQISALGSGLSLTWALGALVFGLLSDRMGRRKPFLLVAMVVFSLCSILSGLSQGFWQLLASRVVMGAAEGPFLPICLAIIIAASAERRRGLNAGIVQNVFGAIMGTAIAPIVLVWMAEEWSWRAAFLMAGVPGLILALLIWRFIEEPQMQHDADSPAPASRSGSGLGLGLLRQRNIWLCSLISCLLVGWVVVGSIFFPLYLVGPRALDPGTMAKTMAALGLCPAIGGVLVTWISDRVGRRPPLIFFSMLMATSPMAMLWFDGSWAVLTAMLFVGWVGMGVFPLFMGVIPGETLGQGMAATAMGLVVCVGELTGGVFAPLVAGWLADTAGLNLPMYIMIGLSGFAAIVALGLQETNPAVLRRRAG